MEEATAARRAGILEEEGLWRAALGEGGRRGALKRERRREERRRVSAMKAKGGELKVRAGADNGITSSPRPRMGSEPVTGNPGILTASTRLLL